jgi:hypothetical protein
MCNLYTLAPWEVRHLIQHYRLIGRDFEEVMCVARRRPVLTSLDEHGGFQ